MSDDEDFAGRVGPVRPLSGPRKRPPRPPSPGPGRPGGEPAERRALIRPDADEPLLARAPDLAHTRLLELARGERAPEARVDLHRMPADSARQRFLRALEQSALAGQRCLLVIHGRGRRTGDAALREALPGWLDGVAGRILGSAPAVARDGGEGATYVWLRRAPGPGRSR